MNNHTLYVYRNRYTVNICSNDLDIIINSYETCEICGWIISGIDHYIFKLNNNGQVYYE